jgi:hypothetical protein
MADGGWRMADGDEDGTEMQVARPSHVTTAGRRETGRRSRTGSGQDELSENADRAR